MSDDILKEAKQYYEFLGGEFPEPSQGAELLKGLISEVECLTKELGVLKENNHHWGCEVRRVEQKNNKLESENASLRDGYNTALSEVRELAEEKGKLKAENAELKSKVEWIPNSEQAIKDLEEENASLKAELAEAESRVKELEADMPATCDVDGCDAVVACGTPTKHGYRNTCSFHKPDKDEWL